jgi:hypothetical protein
MEDTEWYTQGMVTAGNQISGLSTILVSRWIRRELLNYGYNDVHAWYFNEPFEDRSVPQFFMNEFERGISVCTYRGWVGMEGLSPNEIMNYRAHRRYPFATIITCSSGGFINRLSHTEAMFRSRGGAIGALGNFTNANHVQFNNALITGFWRGILFEEIFHAGAVLNRGRFELWRQYNGFSNRDVANQSRWCNLIGDPATHIYTGVPRIIAVDHPENIALGCNRISVIVVDEENDEALSEAVVCLYKADDEFQMVAETDNEGFVVFGFSQDDLSEGELMVTVTGHNVKAYLGSIEIAEDEFFLGASEHEISDDENGNGNGIPNPGETLDLTVEIENYGTEVPDGGITISAESQSQWAEVVSEPVELEEAPAVGESVGVVFNVELDSSTPDVEDILLNVDVESADNRWNSSVSFSVEAPQITIVGVEIENRDLNPGEIQRLDLTLANNGSFAIEPFTTQLHSSGNLLIVIDQEAVYPSIDPEERANGENDGFQVRTHQFCIPGMEVQLLLSIESENGFRDTTEFIVTIGEAAVDQPFGPDNYGYICFDSGDEDWEMAPLYDWVEIDPNEEEDFRGTNTNLRDGGDNEDESMVVDLPFDFMYYGELFNQLTISTSGWAAFGDWEDLADFRNRRIASAGGPNAQL